MVLQLNKRSNYGLLMIFQLYSLLIYADSI